MQSKYECLNNITLIGWGLKKPCHKIRMICYIICFQGLHLTFQSISMSTSYTLSRIQKKTLKNCITLCWSHGYCRSITRLPLVLLEAKLQGLTNIHQSRGVNHQVTKLQRLVPSTYAPRVGPEAIKETNSLDVHFYKAFNIARAQGKISKLATE